MFAMQICFAHGPYGRMEWSAYFRLGGGWLLADGGKEIDIE